MEVHVRNLTTADVTLGYLFYCVCIKGACQVTPMHLCLADFCLRLIFRSFKIDTHKTKHRLTMKQHKYPFLATTNIVITKRVVINGGHERVQVQVSQRQRICDLSHYGKKEEDAQNVIVSPERK